MKSAFRDWSDVRVFLAVLREGSTLAASRALGLAQPTVARRIDALEGALGLTLFRRDTRGFHPTEAARALTEAAEAMERAAVTFDGAARAARTSTAATIRFTVPPQNLSPGFLRILEDFRTRHPGVTFEFVSTYRTLDLCAGEADIAIRIDPGPQDERLICRRLTTATSAIYGAKSYADRFGLPRSPEEFAGHRFVVVDQAPRSMKMVRWLLDRIEPDQIVTHASDFDGMMTAVRAGIGLAPVPTSLAVDYPELVCAVPPPEGTGIPVYLMISPQAWARPEVKAFAAFFAPRWIAHINRIKAAAGIAPDPATG